MVAGVLQKGGEILIGQRRRDDRHPYKWEFPGGKVEPGETPRAALRRELKEELGIEAEIGPELVRYEHQYPRRSLILLIFHRVMHWSGEIENLVFEQVVWECPENLARYDFLDGDFDFIRRLGRGEFRAGTSGD